MATASLYVYDALEYWAFLPSVAAVATPTVAEFTAGQPLNGPNVIQSITGFADEGTSVAIPDLGTDFTSNIPGRTVSADSTIVFYKSSAAADVQETIRALLPKDTNGYIARIHPVNGAQVAPASTKKCEIWPVRVMSNVIAPPAVGAAGTFTVKFTATAKPTKAAVIA